MAPIWLVLFVALWAGPAAAVGFDLATECPGNLMVVSIARARARRVAALLSAARAVLRFQVAGARWDMAELVLLAKRPG